MKNSPLVSIILPAYNAEKYIKHAVASVLDQSYPNWELIIINDGSTDETTEYLSQVDHPSIKVIHQDNKGVSAARNAGISAAGGELITFLDADDVLPPRSLEVRVNYLREHQEIDIVDGIISVRDQALENEIRSYRPCYQGPLLPRLLRLDDRVFFGPFYMFRSSLIGNTRFNEGMTHAEDLLFCMTLASNNNINYGYVDEIIYHYRSSSSSAMSNMEGLENGYLELLKSVKALKGVSFTDINYLAFKIAVTLFLCWRANGNISRGFVALKKILTILIKS